MEMIERVSRAIEPATWLAIDRRLVSDEDAEMTRVRLLSVARLAIEAMREPTEAMIEEGAYQVPCGQGVDEGPTNLSAARECWRNMIDAALRIESDDRTL